jgi:HlyD family secretion protein
MAQVNRSRLIRRILYVLLGLVIIAFLATRVFNAKKESPYVTEKVTRKDVAQTVDVSGTTEAKSRYQLQFSQTGRVEAVGVKEGDQVQAGQILATLEGGDLAIQLESQKAGLRIAQANLAKTLAGPRQEEINIGRLKVNLAQVDLSSASNAQRNLIALAQKNVDLAAISLNQAEGNYDQARTALDYAQRSANLSSSQSQLSLENAQIGLNQGQEDFAYTTSSGNQSLDQSREALSPRFQTLLQNYLSSLEIADSILGVERPSVFGSAYYLLGGGNTSKIDQAKNLYFQARNNITAYRSYVQNLGLSPQSATIDAAYQNSQNAYITLQNLFLEIKELLNTTPTNENFKFEQLSALIQQVDGSFQGMQQNYNALIQAYQSLKTLENKTVYNNSGSNSNLQLKQNSQNSAYLQSQQTGLTDQKKIDDAVNALNQAQLSLNQAQENYNKAALEYNRQADDLGANIERAAVGVQSADQQLQLLQAPQREVDIAALKGQIDQAWEGVHLAEYRFNQTQLKAPINGTITDVNFKVAENVSLAQPFVILDAQGFLIKALISEADIAKIQRGERVKLTFDALKSDQILPGIVIQISPAETVVQGVIYYEIKIQFDPAGANIKPGMTANATIETASRAGVLTIPARALQYENDKPYVQVLKKDEKGQEQVEKREITVGLEGDQDIEILSGLSENEEVVTFSKK